MENEKNASRVGIGAYIALAVAVLFFSGLFMKVEGMKW